MIAKDNEQTWKQNLQLIIRINQTH